MEQGREVYQNEDESDMACGSTVKQVCPEITATNEEEMLSYVLGLRYEWTHSLEMKMYCG